MTTRTITPITTPRETAPARPAIPDDACTLTGPCGICATLTPAARAALTEALVEPSPVADEHRAARLWEDEISEQASRVRSATLALVGGGGTAWRETCSVLLSVELAKLRALIVAAPADVSVASAIGAHSEATTALAEHAAAAAQLTSCPDQDPACPICTPGETR